jgi:hypothetical protein
MMLARDVLEHYVLRHNRGVRSGDFEPLLEIFADSARLELEGIAGGPFDGKPEIRRAFRERPPSDELLVVAADEPEADVIVAEYAWKSHPKSRAGRLRLELSGASIVRLVIQAI